MSSAITLFSSSRRNGNTGTLINLVADKVGMDVIDLDKMNISPFDYEHKNKGDDFLPLMKKVLTYDHIVFASPVYWYAVSPAMKIFLDRLSDLLTFSDLLDMGRELRGKNGYVVSTSVHHTLSSTFIEAFEKTFDYLGMHYGGFLHMNCEEGFDVKNNQDEIVSFSNSLQGQPCL